MSGLEADSGPADGRQARSQEFARPLEPSIDLQFVYDTAPIGLAFLSPDCRYLQINQRLTEICGISVADHLGRTVREMVPNLAEQVEQLVRYIVESGETVTGVEVNGQRADKVGADRCWLTSWHPLKGPDGRILGVNVAAEEITERKRTLAALASSEQRYRALARASTSLIWTATPDGQLIDSPDWQAFTGQSPEEVRGLGWLAAVHPHDRDSALSHWRASVLQHTPYAFEYRIRRKDGVCVWHEVHANAVLEPDGSVREWVGVCVDVDERRRAAEQKELLNRSVEQALDLIVSVSAAASAARDASEIATASIERICTAHRWQFAQVWYPGNGRLLCATASAWNGRQYAALRQLSGETAIGPGEDLPGRVWDAKAAAWFEEIDPGGPRRLEVARESGLTTALVFPIVLGDEVLAILEFFSADRRNRNDTTVDAVNQLGRILGDIWVRKRAEDELRRTATYLAEAEKLSHTGCWATSRKTGALYWSPEQWRIFGLDPATTDLTQSLFLDMVHPEDRPRVEAADVRASEQKAVYDVPFRIVLRDGTVKHIHSVGQPAFDAAGEVVEYIGVSMDETERKRASAAVQEAQAELARVARLTTMGELAASIAHEINQPLTAVVNNANAALRWLGRADPNVAEAEAALKDIVSEGTRASDVIGRIRGLLRHHKQEYVEIDVNDAIREVVALTSGAMQSRDIAVHTSLAATPPRALGDRIQLQQVVMNLIMNGADAMDTVTGRPRTLRVASQRDDAGGMLISVEDTGDGIDEAIRRRIFDPLFTTKSNGMGMGLSICRSIVEAHGGRLSAAPGAQHGTVFRFNLPATARAAENGA